MMPFHKWKAEQVKADSVSNGVTLFFRSREWYWTAYGTYCKKQGAGK